MKLVSCLSGVATGLSLVGVTPAWAQIQNDSAANSVAVGDIIVTARRVAESTLDVPAAVAVLSNETLREQRINNLLDIGLTTPGLNAARNVNSTLSINYNIRGQGVSDRYGSPPSVINYFNEVPSGVLGTPLFDLDSVQVLKGPQGTLFGGSATGGAVLFTSKRPTFDGIEGYAQGSLGNFNYREMQGAINLPVTGWLAIRVAGFLTRRDGVTKVVNIPGLRLGDSHQDSFRASIRMEPADWISNDTVYSYDNIDVRGVARVFSGYDKNATCPNFFNVVCTYGTATLQAELDAQNARGPFKIKQTPPSNGEPLDQFFADRWKVHTISNTTNIKFNDIFSIKNIFGYSASSTPRPGISIRGADVDGLEFSGLTLIDSFVRNVGPIAQVTEELQIHGSVKDAIDVWVGGYYQRNHNPPAAIERQIYPNGIDFTTAPSLASNNGQKAVYGQMVLKGAMVGLEGLSVTLGGRETWSKTTVFIDSPLEASTSSKAFTYTASLDYKPSEDVLLYIAHRKGFKPGGSNQIGVLTLPANVGPYVNYKPEILKDVEIGVKTKFQVAGMRGTVDLAAYRQKLSDAQRSIILGGITVVVVNAQSATIKGLEFDTALQLSDRLRVSGSYAYIKPQWDEYLSPLFGWRRRYPDHL
ncbi:TonB-dependent receptor [Sphingobium mellinum]|uniref:TonB-dependent receptor n=1 Tax=Sphingobium mellinum TaxID=1387166 RepID=UPI0030EEEF24